MKVVPITEANGRLEGFDLAWSCYPRKVARLEAQRAWEQTKRIRPPIEALLAAVNKLALSTTDKQFCPHFATWLRRGQWADED